MIASWTGRSVVGPSSAHGLGSKRSRVCRVLAFASAGSSRDQSLGHDHQGDRRGDGPNEGDRRDDAEGDFYVDFLVKIYNLVYNLLRNNYNLNCGVVKNSLTPHFSEANESLACFAFSIFSVALLPFMQASR